MKKRSVTKLVRAGNYVAEVDVELIEDTSGWSPYLSVADAGKLDTVRQALKDGDLQQAAKWSRIFTLTPVFA